MAGAARRWPTRSRRSYIRRPTWSMPSRCGTISSCCKSATSSGPGSAWWPWRAALAAAFAFMGAPRLLGHLGAGHLTMIQAAAWFPWLALACWGTVRRPRRWTPALALCLALLVLAGHPQLAYYGVLLVVALAL